MDTVACTQHMVQQTPLVTRDAGRQAAARQGSCMEACSGADSSPPVAAHVYQAQPGPPQVQQVAVLLLPRRLQLHPRASSRQAGCREGELSRQNQLPRAGTTAAMLSWQVAFRWRHAAE